MANERAIHAVTGAFGYSGKYLTKKLLGQGQTVITLTNSPHRPNPFGDAVQAFPFHFERPEKLVEGLRGVRVLYNTYWVRFNHRTFTFADAVRNTEILFQAAREAGVERIVHVSITNPAEDAPLEYFRGKARLERVLRESGQSHAILRPAVLFGKEDILINNMAWVLRRLPIFGVFGDGRYRLQPIYVEDLAELAVAAGSRRENEVIQAIGPETYRYREMVELIGRTIGHPRRIIEVPPWAGYAVSTLVGWLVRDVVITREEIAGLMADLLHVDAPPTGRTRLSAWIQDHADSLGRRYTSELARRRNRESVYQSN